MEWYSTFYFFGYKKQPNINVCGPLIQLTIMQLKHLIRLKKIKTLHNL